VVQVRVKVTPKPKSNIKVSKQVRLQGTKDWKEEVNTKPGDTVEWLIAVDNTGDAVLNNIVARDVLPPNVQLVPSSVKWIDASQNAVQNDKPLFDGGINVGNYAGGSGFNMMFATKTLDNFKECQVRDRNQAIVKSNETGEQNDTADVVITKENCQPTKPTTLPNTGPGDIIGIFSATTVAGALAHRFFGRKRFNV